MQFEMAGCCFLFSYGWDLGCTYLSNDFESERKTQDFLLLPCLVYFLSQAESHCLFRAEHLSQSSPSREVAAGLLHESETVNEGI